MRTSKLIAPARDAVQRFFAEELGLGHLITKMLSIATAIVLLLTLGFVMRYSEGIWPLFLWSAVCIAALIRFVIRYWWPVIWQRLSNAGKKIANKFRENHFLEFDLAYKYPFLCTNCRHPKLYYDRMQPVGQMSSSKPICNKCGTTDAVKVLALWHQNPGIEAGLDEFIDPAIARALREREQIS